MIQHTIRFAAAAALTLGGLTFVGCQSNQGPGTMTETGGGSRDVYGNNNTDRYKVGGNMGKDTPPYGGTSSVGTADQTSQNLYGGSSNAAPAGSNIGGSSASQGGGTITNVPTTQPSGPTGVGGIGTSAPPAPTQPPGSGLGGPNGVGSGGASNPNQNGR